MAAACPCSEHVRVFLHHTESPKGATMEGDIRGYVKDKNDRGGLDVAFRPEYLRGERVTRILDRKEKSE